MKDSIKELRLAEQCMRTEAAIIRESDGWNDKETRPFYEKKARSHLIAARACRAAARAAKPKKKKKGSK